MSTTPPPETESSPDAAAGSDAAGDNLAMNIVRRNALWAMGVGLVPLPVVDVLGVSAVQLKMVRELAEHHHLPFSETDARSLITALVGGLGSVTAAGVAFSLLKFVPIVGQTAAALAMPATVGAATYALGRVFIQHFSTGGTLRNLDPGTMSDYFRKEFEAAKDIVRDLRKGSDRG
jgi:uncharacterized protein (DUF697 family)